MRSNDDMIRAMVRELAPLRFIYRGLATPRWMDWLARTIWALETTGATGFGGPDVLAWWLVQRALPRERMTRATRDKLVRMAGRSQKALDLLVAVWERRSAPTRLQRGWSFMEVTSYVSQLRANRLPGVRYA